jgi:hypothetical protein
MTSKPGVPKVSATLDRHLLGEEGGLMPSEWECSPSKANSEGHLLGEEEA